MNTILKKVISLVLCLVLVVGYVPASAFATETGETVTTETTAVTAETTGEASEETEDPSESAEAPAAQSEEAEDSDKEEESENESKKAEKEAEKESRKEQKKAEKEAKKAEKESKKEAEPSTEATEPSTEATELSTEATEPSTEGTEPSTEATEPSAEVTEPSTEATEPEVIAVTGITLDQTALEVGVGELPVTLTARVLPENATDKTVTWTSSEPGVASVVDGIVEFGYMGEATITATAGDFSTTCTVTVGEGNWSDFAAGETTYVLAGSDFQARDGHNAGATIVGGLLAKIQVDYPIMNGFLFAGDYDVNYNDSANGKAKLQEAVQAVYGTEMEEIYVQGNHDGDNLVGSTLTASGANDAENYGVFVINEKDYMWYNNDEATIKKTAENLESYLNAKRNADYTKPIFVVSHLPLHYSMRTRSGGNDGMHANYIFDVLNEAGNAGLNIIFMFGHNHSHGWDDYLGGAAIFLKKGDKINIAQNSTTVFKEETLAFTYMNAGYVGYYGDSYTSTVDKTLTMTTFVITDEEVVISRYDSNGTHDLKSAGVYNVEYPDSTYYSTDTTTVGTPYTLTLNTEITPAGEEIEAPNSGNTGSGTASSIEQVTALEQGVPYIIVCNRNGLVLTGTTTTNKDGKDSLLLSGTASVNTTDLWYYDGTHLIYGDPDSTSTYLLMSTDTAYLGESHSYRMVDDVFLNNDGATFTLKRTDDGLCLNQYGGGSYTAASPYTADGNSDAGSKWRIYKVVTSSGGSVDTSGGNWVTITEPTSGTTTYKYTQATSITGGQKYVIVADSAAIALMNNNDSMGAQSVTINGSTMTSSTELTEWTFSSATHGTITHGTRGLCYYDKNFSIGNATEVYITNNGTNFKISGTNSSLGRALHYSGSAWSTSNKNTAQYVRLYQFTDSTSSEGTAGLYGKVSGELTYNVANGTSKEDALAAVKAGIDILYHYGDANAAQTFPDDGDGMTWTLDPSDNGSLGGEYPVTIAYNGVTLGTAKVVVPNVKITGYELKPNEGSVQKGASQAAQTGAELKVTLENGTHYTVPVTLAMLSKGDGSAVSTGEEGTFDNLKVTYNGVVVEEFFTLHVVAKSSNNYPEYPNEGAVKVSKTGTGIDFQSSGIAQVEISASGVPIKKGADVIVMLDLSSSMTNTVDGKSRLSVLEASLQSLMTQLKANGDDGQPMDIRIAVADFNRYYTDSNSPYYINSADHLINGSIRTNDDGTNKVYTGSKGLNANAFVSVHDLAVNAFSGLGTKSGTNYDYAFDAIYQLGEAITTQNAADGVKRDLFVIFMSDGAPFQYNYFSSQSDDNGATYWNNWLQGTMTDAMFASGSNKSYYNADGKHWMAEAIKGNPASTYPVIRKNNAADTDGDNWVNVNGLGAKMYSIGFCLAVDKEITVASMDAVIRNIATSDQYYFRANTAADLNNAFTAIGGDIAYAAYNARFVDQMGDAYNLQLKSSTYKVVEDGTEKEKTIAPVIEVLTYDIYTKAEAGQIPTGKNIGDRKGTYALKEVVKFSDDGTKAYSNLIDKDKDGTYGVTVNTDGTYTISDPDDNILSDGVISATTFWYNTNPTAVEVGGVSIPTGTNANGTTTGSTNVLPSETFYWKMGTVQTSELAMRYYVYLEGSMEGTKEGGSYPTNEFATLYYDNYLGNPCKKDTVSPVMAWKEANVSYAFYLVNDKGEIIVNQTTGLTGSFANKVAVTNPVVYETVLLNNEGNVQAIKVADVKNKILPLGYELYDSGAEYEVTIKSNTTGSWAIKKGDNKVASTYVTQYKTDDAAAYSNALTNNAVGDDYTHTVVWFAVLWKVQALPDSVVIDYGLPVDISVLTNDMFGENGKLAGVGAYNDSLNLNGRDTTLASGFGTSYTGTYGTAEADTSTGKVRYTLNKENGMQMQTYEKFAYAVNYTGNENTGYYYDTVTVIPATTIYYEDSFLTFSATGTEWEDEKDANAAVAGATQAEDRPGQYSLTDANNIYGYDPVNDKMSTYSLGTAKMVHVGPLTEDTASYANASFTFYGTGFDIISMTSNTTGVLAIKVTAAEDIVVNGETVYAKDDKVKSTVVDTYYGYNYGLYEVTYTYNATTKAWTSKIGSEITTEGAVEVKSTVPENPADGATYTNKEYRWVCVPDVNKAIYQVPVLQANDLPYGKYNALLTATYIASMDDTTAKGYDLYLDAVRIYDPANDGAADGTKDTTIEDAYVADGEGWPSYIELRNKIIAANSFDNVANDALTTDMEGLVFIDGDASVGDAQISDYVSYGPNNEVYLAPGQRVAFLLSDVTKNVEVEDANGETKTKTESIVKNIHIGIKSADGGTGTYTITNIAKATDAERGIQAGDYYGEKTYTVNTATDMYYDLTGWRNDIIVISNTGDRYNTAGVISLTNIKATYTEDPNGTVVAAAEDDNNGVMVTSLTEEATNNEVDVYVTPAAATLTLRSLNRAAIETPEDTVPEESVPETTVPEESVPETTVPETTDPEETVPETTVPEETEDQRQQVEEQIKEVVQTVVSTVRNVLKNLFSKWFS